MAVIFHWKQIEVIFPTQRQFSVWSEATEHKAEMVLHTARPHAKKNVLSLFPPTTIPQPSCDSQLEVLELMCLQTHLKLYMEAILM